MTGGQRFAVHTSSEKGVVIHDPIDRDAGVEVVESVEHHALDARGEKPAPASPISNPPGLSRSRVADNKRYQSVQLPAVFMLWRDFGRVEGREFDSTRLQPYTPVRLIVLY